MWYAGIDWADTHHVVVVLNEQGQQVATKQVDHTVEGLAQLTTLLLGIVGTPEGSVARNLEGVRLVCLPAGCCA